MLKSIHKPLLAGALVTGFVSSGWLVNGWVHAQATAEAPILKRDLVSFRDVVKSVMPAVVSVESRANLRGDQVRIPVDEDDAPEGLKKFFDEVDPDQNPSRTRERKIGFGSGFIVDPKGIVLTNFHVVEKAERVEITLADGRKFISKEIIGDHRTDLAIIRLDVKNATLPYLELGDSGAMEIGDRVLAIGAPFGLSGSVTHGIVSAKGRELDDNQLSDAIQTDAAINPGNSGGPLVNLDGKVIGITSAIKSQSGGFQGVGLAISSNLTRSIMDQLIKNGGVRRGYLGIQLLGKVAPAMAKKLGIEDGGVVIGKVSEDSPASKAGLKPKDAITAINGKSVKDFRELQRVVASLPVKSKATVSLVRDGKPLKVDVVLEEEPKSLKND